MKEDSVTSRAAVVSQVLVFIVVSSAVFSWLIVRSDSLTRIVVVPFAFLLAVFHFVPFSQEKIKELEGGGLANDRTRHLAATGHFLICISVLAGGLLVLLPGTIHWMVYLAMPLAYLNFIGKVTTVAAGRAVGKPWSPLISSLCDLGVLGLPVLLWGNMGLAILSSLAIAFLGFALFLRYLRALASAFQMERQVRLSFSLIPGLVATMVLAVAGLLILPDSALQYLSGLVVSVWLAAYLYLIASLGFAFSNRERLQNGQQGEALPQKEASLL